MTKTYDVTCPNCSHEFTTAKTPEQLEDETDETTCPSCEMVALSYLEEDDTLTLVDEYDDDEDDEEEGDEENEENEYEEPA